MRSLAAQLCDAFLKLLAIVVFVVVVVVVVVFVVVVVVVVGCGFLRVRQRVATPLRLLKVVVVLRLLVLLPMLLPLLMPRG